MKKDPVCLPLTLPEVGYRFVDSGLFFYLSMMLIAAAAIALLVYVPMHAALAIATPIVAWMLWFALQIVAYNAIFNYEPIRKRQMKRILSGISPAVRSA